MVTRYNLNLNIFFMHLKIYCINFKVVAINLSDLSTNEHSETEINICLCDKRDLRILVS